ncbi:hypothetical protein KZX50_23715 [Bacillus infantis]|uniref:hypothetical protein n=1 Tax=Bacillus infantis TaxID=324767 RepID=UPI002004E521|nr:hypothetical protein [Bacillus infantis]MCK6208434.1 hypothetical protein [Bacillus infantis]
MKNKKNLVMAASVLLASVLLSALHYYVDSFILSLIGTLVITAALFIGCARMLKQENAQNEEVAEKIHQLRPQSRSRCRSSAISKHTAGT